MVSACSLVPADSQVQLYILVVEGNPAIQDMLRWTLEFAGYSVVTMPTDADLVWIDSIFQKRVFPALIVLDVNYIAEMDISAFVERLHIQLNAYSLASPPILFLTTSREVYSTLYRKEQVLLKPFHIYDVVQAVQHGLSKESFLSV